MFYNSLNVRRGTTVHDLDTRETLKHVISLDTDKGTITVAEQPLRVEGDRIATHTLRYQAIWPILDKHLPCAFHCHGRQP